MSRSHSQTGHVRLRTDVSRPYWEGFFRLYSEEHPQGVLKSSNLGFKEEVTRKQAQSRLPKVILQKESEIVRQPRSVMTVKGYVEVAEEAIDRLRQFKARVPNVTEDDWVFPDPKHLGRPMTEQNALRCGLKKAGKKLGLHLTWHGLRHWAGTMLFYENVDVKTIQSRLGHADFRTTANWYIHANVEAAREAAQVASKFVDGGDTNPAVSPEIVRVTVRVKGGQAGETMVSS
ncbi:MAG: tyrosine-type recombinase/integrase [Terriglobia bacterium]